MTIQDRWCSSPAPDNPATDKCRATENLRFFATGWKCPIHTPNALRGLPELEPGPGIPAYRPCGQCPHIQREHTHGDPFKPGKCRVCRCPHFKEKT